MTYLVADNVLTIYENQHLYVIANNPLPVDEIFFIDRIRVCIRAGPAPGQLQEKFASLPLRYA
jgi:hypothetical protein